MLAVPCVRFLEQFLKPTDHVLEYGSGASTPWLADRVAKLFSVENDRFWFARVSQWTEQRPNVELKLFDEPPDPDATGGQVGMSYLAYADSFQPESFDVILDDGWARAEIALKAVNLLNSGGLLIFDDNSLKQISEMTTERMLRFRAAVSEWRQFDWNDGTQSTSAFLKPPTVRPA